MAAMKIIATKGDDKTVRGGLTSFLKTVTPEIHIFVEHREKKEI